MNKECWIWLPKKLYPDNQKTIYSGFLDKTNGNFTVAEFKKTYTYDKKVVSAKMRFCADTGYQLYLNGNIVATGPVSVGGDFIENDTPRDNFYSFETEIEPNACALDFFARVYMMPFRICDYSKGQGGFMLTAILTFEDGTEKIISTDDTWLVRKNGAYLSWLDYNGSVKPDAYVNAQIIDNVWSTETAPIPVRVEYEISPEGSEISVSPFEEKTVLIDFDKIYGGFVQVKVETAGEFSMTVKCRELEETPRTEKLTFLGNGEYRGFFLHSVGNLIVKITNGSAAAKVKVSLIVTHYPVLDSADTVTDDAALNSVLQTCKHTLKICRQTHHLDSPRHCEPLACTGDYYIESLMTMFSFGDMRLAEFDLERTAVMLERQDGRLFHTTYSLIFVKMLYDVYMATGKKALLEKCKTALILLFNRFDSYLGDNGLIENPPDYMFLDWIYIDEFSLHHPPKALGQTCLNMFYFGALSCGEKIFAELNSSEFSKSCADKKESLKKAINTLLFDSERGIYFEGLNTPTDENAVCKWMPQNTDKRYYLKHSNILAAYFGVCDDALAKNLVEKIMLDKIGGEYQPYFAHFLLEAVFRLGLRDKYTLEILRQWKEPVHQCTKGLVEGFILPNDTYRFDHSHAWGGTPLYSLPKALIGFEIVKAGMEEIKLSPSLLGLKFAKVEILTPFGKVICEMQKGYAPKIICPKEISIITE